MCTLYSVLLTDVTSAGHSSMALKTVIEFKWQVICAEGTSAWKHEISIKNVWEKTWAMVEVMHKFNQVNGRG